MWDLGNITAFGVALAWAYSILLLPALVAVLPVRGRELALNASLSMEKLADFVIRRRWWLLGTMSAITVALALAITRFEINDRPVEYFGRNNSFRQATEFMTQNLTGFYGMNISLPSGEPGGINDPKYLAMRQLHRLVARSQRRLARRFDRRHDEATQQEHAR
jgi:predicted RND superfamily exporter protein